MSIDRVGPARVVADSAPDREAANSSRIAHASVGSLGTGADRQLVARSLRAGVWIWPTFLLLDAYMCFVAYPDAPFGLFVGYRVVVELGFIATYRAALREKAQVGHLLVVQRLMFCTTALVIALMAVPLGGIRSPYMHGISLVALVWAALVSMPWRRALSTFLGIGLAFPLVIGAVAAVSASARAEWLNREALTVFASHYVFVVASATLGLILSHLVWKAQHEARLLGSYELEQLLGRGGMGEVWRARHRLLARAAAIKVIRPETLGGSTAQRATAVARFEREARVTASLRSPHTVQLYDFGVSDKGAFYYVMELLDGLDAADLVNQTGPMSAARVVHLLRQVCESLGEAHESGLVHRDIKPSNILVCRYGRIFDFVKVLDFGLVKPLHGDDAHLTGDFAVTGTPAFMSPEQALGDGVVDARSDVYALGCLGYWLLTGQHVFSGTTMQTIAGHVGSAPTPPSRRLGQPVAQPVEQLVMDCLEKNPDHRPQSADAVAERLAVLAQSHPWSQDEARQWWQGQRPQHLASNTPTRKV